MDSPRGRVLVVDDEPSFADLVGETLEEKGFDVAVYSDPVAALGAAAAADFAVAVVDLVMPGMGGFELAQRLRETNPDTQVIVLTGHADMESALQGLKVGVLDYIPKQSMPLALLEASAARAMERFTLVRENRALIRRLEASNRLLRSVQEMGTSLSGEAYLDRLLTRLVAAAKELSGAAAGRAMLFRRTHDLEGLTIEIAAGDGGDAVRGARLQAGEGIATLAMDREEFLDVADPPTHPRYSHRCDEMPTRLPGLLAAPLSHGTVRGALLVAGREAGFSSEQGEIVESIARHAAVAIDNAVQHERSVNFFAHVSDLLVGILDGMDVHYPGHSRRVAALSDMVSRRLGLDDEERRQVHFGGLLHDIGKIRLSSELLHSHGTATAEQWAQIRQHPSLGVEVLRPITVWEDILPLISNHHERWDGKGYPHGLEGEAIPLGARIIAVAEVFDAISRRGPHVPDRTIDEALAEIERCAGTQFDPRIARLFVEEYRLHAEDIHV